MRKARSSIFLGAALLLAACVPNAKTFRSDSGRFSVQTPVELTESTRPAEGDIGRITLHLFSGQGKTHGFAVVYADSPYNQEKQNPDPILDITRDSSLAGMQGKLISEKKITVDGHPGREIVANGVSGGQNIVMNERIFLVGHRGYQFIITAPLGKMNQTATDAFLQSAKLDPPPAPPPASPPAVFNSERGHFSVATPVPLMETLKVANSANGPYTVHLFNGAESGPTFMVMYYDSPTAAQRDAASFVRSLSDNAATGVEGKITSEKAVNLGKYPGWECSYTFPKIGRTYTAKSRIYLAGSRVFQVQAITSGDLSDPALDAYLDSLAITAPTTLPATAGAPHISIVESTPTDFISTSGLFSIKTPIAFQENTRTVSTEIGPSIMHMFVGDAGSRAYFVAYSDYPVDIEDDDPEAQLDGTRNGETANLNGKIESEKKITLSGHPGLALALAGVKNGKAMRLTGRIYIVGHRLYQVFVMSEQGQEMAATADDFLQSFQILGSMPSVAQPDELTVPGQFSINAPVRLSESSQPIPTATGNVTLHQFTGGEHGYTYQIFYTDHNANLETMDPATYLNNALTGALEAAKGHLVSRQAITIDTHPGIAAVFTSTSPTGVTHNITLKLYIVGPRLYQLYVAAPASATTSAPVDDYFNSFKLLPPATPAK